MDLSGSLGSLLLCITVVQASLPFMTLEDDSIPANYQQPTYESRFAISRSEYGSSNDREGIKGKVEHKQNAHILKPQIPRWDRSAPGSELIQSKNEDVTSSRWADSPDLNPTAEGSTGIQYRPPRDAESSTSKAATTRVLPTAQGETQATLFGQEGETASPSKRRTTATTTTTTPFSKALATEATVDGAQSQPKDEDKYVPFAGQRLDAFDWKLCREMNGLAPSNAAVSPVGVKLVLGMLHEAASRDASRELLRALWLPKGRRAARETFRHVISSLQEKHNGYIMKVGNKVYLDKAFTPLRNISRIFDSYYSASIIPVNFQNTQAVKHAINSWVFNFTNGQIPNLISNEHQLENVVSMILNVIYFKGEWLYPFPKGKIQEGDFYVKSNKTVKVEYMEIREDLYYTESEKLGAKMLRLPYKGKKYSMFLLLPNEKENFNKMLEHITPEEVRQLLHDLRVSDVHVLLPKFKFDFTIQLKEILQKVGITRIFEQSDEINLVTTRENIGISKIIQKIGFEVNEEGTKASSVVEGVVGNKIGGSHSFLAKHPFLFFIEEEKTGTVVFIGKVVNPVHNKPELQLVPSRQN